MSHKHEIVPNAVLKHIHDDLMPLLVETRPSQETSNRARKHESRNGQGRVKKQLEASQEAKVKKTKITTGKLSQETRTCEPGNAIQE